MIFLFPFITSFCLQLSFFSLNSFATNECRLPGYFFKNGDYFPFVKVFTKARHHAASVPDHNPVRGVPGVHGQQHVEPGQALHTSHLSGGTVYKQFCSVGTLKVCCVVWTYIHIVLCITE